MPKKSFKKNAQKSKPAIQKKKQVFLYQSTGLDARQTIKKPTVAIRTVQAVEISVDGKAKIEPSNTIVATKTTSAKPPGIARFKILLTKLPRIKSWFGACESKKPGIPIVNILISEICAGISG